MTDNTIETTDEGESDGYIEDPTITEEEIQAKISEIELILDSSLAELNSDMKPYQEQWEAHGMTSISYDFVKGLRDGAKAWAEDAINVSWDDFVSSLEQIKESLDQFAKQQIKHWILAFGKPEIKLLLDVHHYVIKNIELPSANSLKNSAKTAMKFVNNIGSTASQGFDFAVKAFEFKTEIFDFLVALIANDVEAIEKFIDQTLPNIDADLAKFIKKSEGYSIFLALLQDPQIIPMFVSYLQLTFLAVTPNFYFYVFGAAGAYIGIEIVITVVLALISKGVGAALRIATLLKRLESFKTLAKANKIQEELLKAFESMINMIKCLLEQALNRILSIGSDIAHARSRNVILKGTTRTTMTTKGKSEKRPLGEKCLLCDSSKHTTVHGIKKGTLQAY